MSHVLIKDIIKFLEDKRPDLKISAIETVADLTGTDDGVKLIVNEKKLLSSVIDLLCDPNPVIVSAAFKVLINVSSYKYGAESLLNLENIKIIQILVNFVQNPEFLHANLVCGVLANLTRISEFCPEILTNINQHSDGLNGLVSVLCEIGFNKKGNKLDHLASVIANLTQCQEGRRQILDRDKTLFLRLLPFINYGSSAVIRRAAISAVHNCCFEKDFHEWLLTDDVDITSYLALPISGPDVFTLEENESLPFSLQFLPDDKEREEDPHLRLMLLESFMQLCTTKEGRERLRNLNIYLIMREHHKWEKDVKCQLLNEDVVNLLLKHEDEIGEDDLSAVQIPRDVAQKFLEMEAEMSGNE